MSQNCLIQIRVEEDLKAQSDRLFKRLGMDTPTAVRLFLTQAVLKGGIPFPITATADYDEIEMPSEVEVFETGKSEIEIINDLIEETANETSDDDLMCYPEYNDADMKQLRNNLKSFVSKKYPNIKYIDACNWAFFALNPKHKQYLNVDFWNCFLERDFDLIHRRLFEYGQMRGVMNPKNDADSYIRSMCWLDEYFEEVHGGVSNYLKQFEI